MAHIPGYTVTVLRNGEPVNFTSGSFTRDAGKVAPSWEVTLAEPLNIAVDDVWTIKRGFAGFEQTLVEDCAATSITGQDGVESSSRTVSCTGDAQTQDILEYCAPKTLVFVNPAWLQANFPTARLEDKIIKDHGTRVSHTRLPGKEFEDTDFECILTCRTHQDIARYLCGLIGYGLACQTPLVNLIDTCTVASGTTWFEAIKANFLMWGAHVTVLPATNGKPPTIYIMDVLSNEEPDEPLQTLNIDNPAIVSVSFQSTTQAQKEITDHVIVTGRKTHNTTTIAPETPDFTPVELPEIALSDDLTVETHGDLSGNAKYKVLSEYNGNYGTPDDYYVVRHASQAYQTTHYHQARNGANVRYLPISEETRLYDGANQLIGKMVVTYTYGPGKKIIRTREEEYQWTNMPGSDQFAMRKLRVKTTCQDQFVKPLNLTLTSEIIEDVVLYEEVEIDGETYKTDPRPMIEALRNDPSRQTVDKDPDTSQKTLEMTTHWRKTFISRTDDNTLIKRDMDYSPLTGAQKVQSQILDNPLRDLKNKKADSVFRKEYFNGPGKVIGGYGPCYHKPKTISHDDIDTEALADKLAARAFAYDTLNSGYTVTVKTPVVIPIDTLLLNVSLPDFDWLVNGETVTVPGGEYFLKQVHEEYGFEGDENQVDLKYEQTLQLRQAS